MNFTTNSKVVCVDDSPPQQGNTAPRLLVKGQVFNIEAVESPRFPGDIWGVRVTGHPTYSPSGQEVWWAASRFRRLEDVQAENRATTAEPCTV